MTMHKVSGALELDTAIVGPEITRPFPELMVVQQPVFKIAG